MGRPKGSKNKPKLKPFSELRAKMPVESQKRAKEKAQGMLAELDQDAEILHDDADKKLVEGLVKEESEVVVSKRESASVKWNAMNIEERRETIQDMINSGYIPISLKRCVADLFCGREEEDTRFGYLLFNIQDEVSSYLRKR